MALANKIFKNKPEKINSEASDKESKTEIDSLDLSTNVQKQELEPALEAKKDYQPERSASVERDVPGLAPAANQSAPTPVATTQKSIALQKIENILEEDMEDIYFHLDSAHQKLFKEEGERAARQIEGILATGKSVAVKILTVIKKWLQSIPGINKFFLEQEAKIKTDKISKINNSESPK